MALTVLPAGTTTWNTETTIPVGDTLRFPDASSATLVMDNKNLIINGRFESHPVNASVIHTLRFINVDEEAFVGGTAGGMSMIPLTTDIGLWVMGIGVLDFHGTPKAGWNRIGTDPTWSASDAMFRSPWAPGDYTTYAPHTLGQAPESLVDPWGTTHTNEVFNLTRNVRIEGTPGHKAHVLVMTPGVAQSIEYVSFQHLGPRKATGDSNISAEVRGRWSGVHFHHLGNAYTTVARGCVAMDGGSHAFVAHGSHGVTFEDCISFGMNEDAYWWDKEALSDASHDVNYIHCYSGKLIPIPAFRGSQLAHFLLLKDTGTITDCCGTGNMGGTNSAFMIWPEKGGNDAAAGTDLWVNHNNVGHNNRFLGSFFWQNNNTLHVVEDFTAFRNGDHGVRHGSYRNAVKYRNLTLFENAHGDLNLLATNAQPTPNNQTYSNVKAVTVPIEEHHLLNAAPPIPVQNSQLGSVTIKEDLFDSKGAGPGEYDFIRCGLETTDFSIPVYVPYNPGPPINTGLGMNKDSVIRVQRDDNTAFTVTSPPPGNTIVITDIAPFALYVATPSLPSGTTTVAYSQQLVTALASGAVTWGLQTGSGPLPTGLSLSAGGLISGTPSVVGTFAFTVLATDAAGYEAPKTLSIQIVSSGTPLQITTTTLVGGFVGSVYSDAVLATGGTVPRTFGLVAGALPAGLSLSSAGAITGAPTQVQFSTFTVRVTDNVAAIDDQVLSINVVNLNPSVKKTTPPPGEVGLLYSHQFLANGGTPGYTFASILGPLPPGTALGAGGLLNGTPAVAGPYPIRIQVTDSLGRTGVRDFTIVIASPLAVTVPAVPLAFIGEAFLLTFLASGGIPPYTFSVRGGDENLPLGLALSVDGVLSGIPISAPGIYAFTVDVFVGSGGTVALDIVLEVQHAQVITTWLPDTDVSTTWAPDADVTTAWST